MRRSLAPSCEKLISLTVTLIQHAEYCVLDLSGVHLTSTLISVPLFVPAYAQVVCSTAWRQVSKVCRTSVRIICKTVAAMECRRQNVEKTRM